MDRRQLLKMIAASTGMGMFGATGALAYIPTESVENLFTEDDVLMLDELAETIIPRTDTPGAKDAEVGRFMTTFVSNCYTPEEQELFQSGLQLIEALSQEQHSKAFVDLSDEERHAMLSVLNREAREAADQKDPHYFTMMKQLTIFGFFTSRVGATEVLRYLAVPGRYDGNMPYEAGQPAWAT